MPDQAETLRRLMRETTVEVCAGAVSSVLPPTIVVTGGKGGVGTTTVAINLAAALVQYGRRTVLVDAAPNADIGPLLGVERDSDTFASLEDVLAGTVSVDQALAAAPAGLAVLASRWAATRTSERSPRTLERLLAALATLRETTDILVIDAGSEPNGWTRQLWQQAAMVLLVTTPDDMAVMDTYATIKRCLGPAEDDDGGEFDLRVLVNACPDTATSVDVQSRVSAACRRFLGRSIGRAPLMPRHLAEVHALKALPLAWQSPLSPLARHVHQLGRFACDALAHRKRAARQQEALAQC